MRQLPENFFGWNDHKSIMLTKFATLAAAMGCEMCIRDRAVCHQQENCIEQEQQEQKCDAHNDVDLQEMCIRDRVYAAGAMAAMYGAFCPADAAAPPLKVLLVFFPSSCRLSQCVLYCTCLLYTSRCV